jgi:NTE family protein
LVSAIEEINNLEKVLILQGGGSLGAFGCGVFKAIEKRGLNLDIVAGTSIGGINAAIIAGTRETEDISRKLEEFWIELSEGFIQINPLDCYSEFEPSKNFENIFFPPPTNIRLPSYFNLRKEQQAKIGQITSFMSSATFGNNKFFLPRWIQPANTFDAEKFTPWKWTYIYDHSPLVKTLEKYVDYEKLNPTSANHPRLILTAVNVLNSQALTFDSNSQQIKPKHILATSAYPLYNFPWIEIERGVYAWDGGLLSNTPMREVLDASPILDKVIFLIENYPKKIDALPSNLGEVYHRARDIMFSDKTEHNVKMAATITRYLDFIKELYQIVDANKDRLGLEKKLLQKIDRKYKKYRQDHGAEIKKIFYISRNEEFPHIYENADFSPKTIKNSIRDGEEKADKALYEYERSRR